jgi:2-oxoglutarate ferredoxin oxidoreductase subunit beta
VYKLEDDPAYDPTDFHAAWEKAAEWGERIPLGIVYRDGIIPTYEDQVPALAAGPLVDQPLTILSADQVTALQAEIR